MKQPPESTSLASARSAHLGIWQPLATAMSPRLGRLPQLAVALVAALACSAASAGPITAGTFFEFGFTDVGSPATGCDPADPAGPFCVPSSGTPTEFADAPAWTFVAPVGGTPFTVVDAFANTDQFEVFDFGASLGLTSAPLGSVDCGDDPIVCLATAGVSQGVFQLAAGPHSITIIPVASDGLGAAYFSVGAAVNPIPEPGTLALLAAAVSVLTWPRRWRHVARAGGRS